MVAISWRQVMAWPVSASTRVAALKALSLAASRAGVSRVGAARATAGALGRFLVFAVWVELFFVVIGVLPSKIMQAGFVRSRERRGERSPHFSAPDGDRRTVSQLPQA